MELDTARSIMLELQESIAAMDLADATLGEDDPTPLDALAATAATLSRLATAYAAPLHEEFRGYGPRPKTVEELRAHALDVLHGHEVPDAEILLSGKQLEDIADGLWHGIVRLRPLFNDLDTEETGIDLMHLTGIAEAFTLSVRLLHDYAIRRGRDVETVRGWATPPAEADTAPETDDDGEDDTAS